ncbi:DUF397 domain-containing protein [Streptomyces sp. CMB-StM0423]|uniref:DUF397 domain-containing protein n=1 Tax=Streptomyces sp. CMB-StM0423 TaxID=2059884 RepID=UPI000C6FF932|nr:DUF397 domain-containing protein [Streptomyces sp. CMB-StM0423]AUH45083.1 DUF397 domain-containing protein [Streptomyces sp. CMB-StM0423]
MSLEGRGDRHLGVTVALEEQSAWCKSSFSGSESECVELAIRDGAVLARDSKNRTGAVLAFTPTAWSDFLAAVVSGELAGS